MTKRLHVPSAKNGGLSASVRPWAREFVQCVAVPNVKLLLDCPSDCAYLIAAHRYELDHRKPLAESEVPFPNVEFSSNLIYDREPVLAALGSAVLQFAARRPELTDLQVLAAAAALAETYRTLSSGIYYEKPPVEPLSAELYAALGQFVQDYKNRMATAAERRRSTTSKTVKSIICSYFWRAWFACAQMAAPGRASSCNLARANAAIRLARTASLTHHRSLTSASCQRAR